MAVTFHRIKNDWCIACPLLCVHSAAITGMDGLIQLVEQKRKQADFLRRRPVGFIGRVRSSKLLD